MSRPLPAIPMPLSGLDVLRACASGPGAVARFEAACQTYHHSAAAFAVSSARTALWLALRVLRRAQPARTTVVVPAYTCPTVGQAVQVAGLQGLCVDVSAQDFNLEPGRVTEALTEETLAVIAPHMFGTPCALDAIGAACSERGIALIEDAAQACGARFAGRPVGSYGAMAALSLGRSKNLRGYQGGVLLINQPAWVAAVQAEVAALPQAGLHVADVGKQLAISALASPYAWNAVRQMKTLQIGAEDQEFDECPARLAPWLAAIGEHSLTRLERYNALRADLGQALEQALAGLSTVQVQRKSAPGESAYVRLALCVEPTVPRDEVLRSLQARAIDARAFYSRPLYHYDWWQPSSQQAPCPNAERIVQTNVVLPLYYAMGQAGVAMISSAIKEAMD